MKAETINPAGVNYLRSVVKSIIGPENTKAAYRIDSDAVTFSLTSQESPNNPIEEIMITYRRPRLRKFKGREWYPYDGIVVHSSPNGITGREFSGRLMRTNNGLLKAIKHIRSPLNATRFAEFAKGATRIEETFDDDPTKRKTLYLDPNA